MFKKTWGFDTDKFQRGIAVQIEDSESEERKVGHYHIDIDGMSHINDNKSGAYLVKESSSTVLRLTDMSGEEVKFHIRHFTDEKRMSVRILK